MPVLKGIYTVLVTPFLVDGRIDFDGMATNIEHQIEGGVHGVLVAGATGEYMAMDTQERKALVEFAAKTIKGRIPMLVGTITSRAETTIELTNHAAECGAAGVMILPPPGSGANMDEVYTFFKTVTDHISIPVMLYNNPGSSGIDIDVDTLAHLAELPHIDCVKESSGDIKRISQIRRRIGLDKLGVFCGWEDMALESMMAGATGWICMSSNFNPQAATKLYQLSVEEKQHDAAWSHYQHMLPMLSFLEESGKPAQVAKYMLDKMDLNGRFCRSPRSALTPSERETLYTIASHSNGLYHYSSV